MDLMTGDDDAMTLEELGAFLASDRVRPGGLGLSGLDGLLAALAVGPGPVEPEEWAPLVWGGDDPAFRDADEARRVVHAIMDRWATIARQLRDDPGAYRPVFRASDDGAEEVAADWAHGFFLAAGLRTAAWRPLFGGEEGGRAMAVLLAQVPAEGGGPRVVRGLGADGSAEARRRARELVPAALATVLRLLGGRRRAGPAGRGGGRGPGPGAPRPTMSR
jgi:yecA family protein